MSIQQIRNWLTINKIFFEVVVATSLSFMAIFISIKTNLLTEYQTNIMRYENTPQIEIRSQQTQNPNTKIYDKTVWLVFNRNSKLSDFDVDRDYSFISFSKARDYSGDSLFIPLKHYINRGGVLTGENEGLIYQFDNDTNGEKEYILRSNLEGKGYIMPYSYIQISYKNIFDEKIIKYYQIWPSIKMIKKDEWEKIEKFYVDNLGKGIYLDDVEKFKSQLKLKYKNLWVE